VVATPDGAFENETDFLRLPATGVGAAARYLGNSRIFCVLAVLTTVVAVSFGHAIANTVRAFVVVVCHTIPLLLGPFLPGG